jgi:hypothetical protein
MSDMAYFLRSFGVMNSLHPYRPIPRPFFQASAGILMLVGLGGPVAAQPGLTALTPTPRAVFTPTPPTRRGYWNIDVVGDFTLPPTKSLTFNGAGRNLHVAQDRTKLFRRGFTAIERTRMTTDELQVPGDAPKPAGWKSPLRQSQRALVLTRNLLADAPFNLRWAADGNEAPYTFFFRPRTDPNYRNSLGRAMHEQDGGCFGFGDCPPTGEVGTYGRIFFDLENEGISLADRQQQINLYVFMVSALRDSVSAATEIGSIDPVPRNAFGLARSTDYGTAPGYLWADSARHTPAIPGRNVLSSQQRGMPDRIVNQTFGKLVDFQMPGAYFTYEALTYDLPQSAHTDPVTGRHWLAGLLADQEINAALSPKKRIAWQWLFNTQDKDPGGRAQADTPAPPAVAEGTAIFYWFTGAAGALFWDDATDLTPNATARATTDPRRGLDSDRHYATYEHYLHGLWRLFHHHADLFDGREQYLNQQTDCSFDNGATWHRYTAAELKAANLPVARAIVNGDKLLVAATMPYAKPDQKTSLLVRYQQAPYNFTTRIDLTGDEIFLGRATMTRHYELGLCNGCKK